MKVGIVISVVASFCVAIALLVSQASSFSRWVNSSVIALDRSEGVSVPRVLTADNVQLADMPVIAAAMSESKAEVRYASLAFCPADCRSDDDSLNIQISMEDRKIGLDWVLLGSRNIRDQERFKSFVQTKGFEVVEKNENGVSYLRVDSKDAAELASRIVTEMYQMLPNETLSLYHEGFDWPQT
jgi:hypothetical protein